MYVVCKLCHKKLKTSGSTSNLYCHLKWRHKEAMKSLEIPILSQDSAYNEPIAGPSSASFDIENDISISVISTDPSISNCSVSKQKTISERFEDILAYKKGGVRNLKILN